LLNGEMANSQNKLATHARANRSTIARKVWREMSRPFRPKTRAATAPLTEPAAAAPQIAPESAPFVETEKPYLTGAGAHITGFHPQQATVELEGIPLIQRLVRESRNFPGPIVEIGTLLGITTTNIALAKAPQQTIITVDLYCWNPWGLAPDVHEALTAQMLHYLVQRGHVERIRMDKNEFYESYRGPAPAMVFLDAVHDYEETCKDIAWAQRAGARIIAGHDYCDEFLGVKQAVDQFGGPQEAAGTVWVLPWPRSVGLAA
jgi:hypothetical protein